MIGVMYCALTVKQARTRKRYSENHKEGKTHIQQGLHSLKKPQRSGLTPFTPVLFKGQLHFRMELSLGGENVSDFCIVMCAF